MAKSLKEILSPDRLGTACGLFQWRSKSDVLLDPNRESVTPITCLKCLKVMAALAITVLPGRPPCSPYCDHTRGKVENTGGSGGPGGYVYGFKCTHCNRAYEWDAQHDKWYELDAEGRRVR